MKGKQLSAVNRAQAVARVTSGESARSVAKAIGVNESTLYYWVKNDRKQKSDFATKADQLSKREEALLEVVRILLDR